MSSHISSDSDRAFRIVIGAIGAILALGLVLLITVVLVYRSGPGRHMPFVSPSSTHAPTAFPTPSH